MIVRGDEDIGGAYGLVSMTSRVKIGESGCEAMDPLNKKFAAFRLRECLEMLGRFFEKGLQGCVKNRGSEDVAVSVLDVGCVDRDEVRVGESLERFEV